MTNDRMHVHRVLGVDDKERGVETKDAERANVVEGVGYTVYVKSEKVCADLLRTMSVR